MNKKLLCLLGMCILPLAAQATPTDAVFTISSYDQTSNFTVDDANLSYHFYSNASIPDCNKTTTISLSSYLPISVTGSTPGVLDIPLSILPTMTSCFSQGAYLLILDFNITTVNGQNKQPNTTCTTEIGAYDTSPNPLTASVAVLPQTNTFYCYVPPSSAAKK